MPKISVIMPAYNAEKYIEQAIDSILGQTFRDFELIVINDCSCDGTESIIASYDDGRLVQLNNEKNMGVAATLNKGLALAKGQYIARMDADDISLPQRLQKQVEFLDAHPETAVLGCAVERFGEKIESQVRQFSADPRQMRIDLLFACGLAHPTVMFRRQAVLDAGGYDPAYEGLEDYALWCKVAAKHTVTALPEVLLRYRVHSAQVTKNPSEQYLNRMQALKRWQLTQLGLPTDGEQARSFYDFCTGSRPAELQQAAVFCAFLESVLTANEGCAIYDQRLLEQNFKSLALQLAQSLPQGSDLCRKTCLVRPGQLAGAHLKQKVKRLLGR